MVYLWLEVEEAAEAVEEVRLEVAAVAEAGVDRSVGAVAVPLGDLDLLGREEIEGAEAQVASAV